MTILKSAAFRVAVVIRVRCLFQCGYPKVRHLFEARRLLEKYEDFFYINNFFGQSNNLFGEVSLAKIHS